LSHSVLVLMDSYFVYRCIPSALVPLSVAALNCSDQPWASQSPALPWCEDSLALLWTSEPILYLGPSTNWLRLGSSLPQLYLWLLFFWFHWAHLSLRHSVSATDFWEYVRICNRFLYLVPPTLSALLGSSFSLATPQSSLIPALLSVLLHPSSTLSLKPFRLC